MLRHYLFILLVLVPWRGTILAAGSADSHVAAAPSRVQSALINLAEQHPSARVHVIVQMTGRNARVAADIAHLDGQVTKDLSIINAVAATLPARHIPELARHAGVRWISLDTPVVSTGSFTPCPTCIDTTALQNTYIRTIRADKVWNEPPYLQGQGIGVAVVDSGVNAGADDLANASGTTRVVDKAKFNSSTSSFDDRYGHGTHIAGIIGGNGTDSQGAYIGVAPKVNLINVKVSDDTGEAAVSDVVNGLQWVLDNARRDNIRVVNLSLNTGTAESYNVDPLDAACEILWNNKIVVVVSAGNHNTAALGLLNAPANDPFVITVGAADDKGTPNTSDDTLASFSAYGTTSDGVSKPDLVAPGVNIVSTLANMGTVLAKTHPDHVVTPEYFRMSGTSVAAPMVAGAAALLLQANPSLTPDQVKYRLEATAHPLGAGTGAGELDINAAIHSSTTASANTGLAPSQLLNTGSSRIPWTSWDSVSWGSVSWGSVSWGSVSWGSVSWGSISWGSNYW